MSKLVSKSNFAVGVTLAEPSPMPSNLSAQRATGWDAYFDQDLSKYTPQMLKKRELRGAAFNAWRDSVEGVE